MAQDPEKIVVDDAVGKEATTQFTTPRESPVEEKSELPTNTQSLEPPGTADRSSEATSATDLEKEANVEKEVRPEAAIHDTTQDPQTFASQAPPTQMALRDQSTLTNTNRNSIEDPTSFSAGPPSLNYTLHTRYRSIAFFWTLILIDSIAMPLVVYFCLRYLTSLSNNAVFSISTACLGGISIVEYVLRFWRLWRKGSTCRVIGARRWYLDWFHWNFSIAMFFVMLELIIGTCFNDPPIRLLAMPLASLCYWFGFELLLEETMRYFGRKQPIRISSVPKGGEFRAAIYSIIEDVVAADGGGGTEFRTRFNARYVASKHFRTMLDRLSYFWSFGSLGIAIVTTALVATIQFNAAYVVGWTLPFGWAAVWGICTIFYVKRCLKRERAEWGRSHSAYAA